MNPFTGRYKRYSNKELLQVIQNPLDYQSEAVAAAKDELKLRAISETELKQLRTELELEVNKKTKANKSFDPSLIIGRLKPVSSTERNIRWIVIVFGLLALFQWVQEFGLLWYIFTDGSGTIDFGFIEILVPLVVLPVALLLLWQRKKIGWILMAVFFTYSAVSAIGNIALSIKIQSLEVQALEAIMPPISPVVQIFSLCLFLGGLMMLNKKDTMEVCQVDLKTSLIAIGITTLISGVLVLPMFF